MGGKGSGNIKGHTHKAKIKPNISIKEVVLTMDKPFGVQLKPFRQMKKYTLREMGENMKWHLSNVAHFENGTLGKDGELMVGNSIRTAASYAKTLGIKQLKIIL